MDVRLTGAALVAIVVLIAAIAIAEWRVRMVNDRFALSNSALATILFYSAPIHRRPGGEISFRLYGPHAQLRASADIRLNNLGYFSKRDYSYERGPNEFRIVVVGGEQTASSVANVSWPDALEDELNRRDPGTRYRVFNVAWPDAGPEHYVQYWKEYGTKFDSDMVIVNYVETDFFRPIAGSPLTYKGQPIGHTHIEYKVGPGEDDVAKTTTANIKDKPVSSYRDPDAVPGRPYGFFVSRAFMDDRKKVEALQTMVVRDMVAGTHGKIVLARIFAGLSPIARPEIERNFDPTPSAKPDQEKMLAFGIKNFGWIATEIPNVIIAHNFDFSERAKTFDLTEAMTRRAPHIRIVDMRQFLPASLSDEEFSKWFQAPYMSEKWSDAGHVAYGRMMADMVTRWRQGWRP